MTLWWFAPSKTTIAYAAAVRGAPVYNVDFSKFRSHYELPPEHKRLHRRVLKKVVHKIHKTVLQRLGYTALDAQAVVLARKEIGKPYVWGGTGPWVFDCSGLVRYVWAKLGVILPHSTYDQWRYGLPVSRDDLREGDTVFFNGLGHEAMYIGGGMIIEAPHSGATVRIRPLNAFDTFYGARRLR